MTVRLAAEGLLDFRLFDRFDPQWWRAWRYQIGWLENRDKLVLLDRRFQFNLAFVSGTQISSDSYTKKQQQAIEVYEDLQGVFRPWLGRTAKERHVEEFEKFRDEWQRVAGFDPTDAEALANWEEQLIGGAMAKADKGQAEVEAAQAQLAASLKIMESIQKKRAAQSARTPRRGKIQ
jgi:hypothetical protein